MTPTEHKLHQTTSNYCIPPGVTEFWLAYYQPHGLGCRQIYRTLETAQRYGFPPYVKVTLTEEVHEQQPD